MMSKIIAVIALTTTMLLSGCHTLQGAGQDVSQAGHAVTNAASSK
jgi:predicted small secreted protein